MSQDNAAAQGSNEFPAADLQAWNKAANKAAPGGDINNLNWTTPDGITVKPLYTAEDTADLAFTNTLPGFAPYVRGPQATMYAVAGWVVCDLPEVSARRPMQRCQGESTAA